MGRKLIRSVVLPGTALVAVARPPPLTEAQRELHRREDAWVNAARYWHWRGPLSSLEVRSRRRLREDEVDAIH